MDEAPRTDDEVQQPRKRSRNRRRGRDTKEPQAAGEGEERRGSKRSGRGGGAPPAKARAAHAGSRTSSTTRAHMTTTRFDSLRGTVSDSTLRAISEVLGYEMMTTVQVETLPICCDGRDVVAKAKTGTGKTLAFMIPALERTVAAPGDGVGALVLSPTRELAQQTYEEGRLLSRFFPPSFKLVCVVGGVPIKKDHAALAQGCDVLVATPGRLNDHVENTPGFADRLKRRLVALVFDEADQLLDMGFRPAIERLLNAIKPTAATRQTLLFSATLPSDVNAIARLAMRRDYAFVDTVVDEQTHADVEQAVSICEGKRQHSVDLALRVQRAVASDPAGHKIIVFFTTARLTQLYYELLTSAQREGYAAKTTFLEIHSRKSQSHRDKVSQRFREATGGVTLLTSDVSARGMDYPDVSSVVQFGAPADAAQYCHRIGRTGRATGKCGTGCLVLASFEQYFLADPAVAALPIARESPLVDAGSVVEAALDAAACRLPEDTVGQAYQAWLGYHNSNLRKLKWSKEHLVAEANEWAAQVCGRASPPPLKPATIGKMGLKGTPGLVKMAENGYADRRGGRGAGRGRGSAPRGGGSGSFSGGGSRRARA
ncbi:hypothetical protein CTAYLR_005023 [Chrysophaeum taylorii]|uniref:ATP-dependent RNA helicase n=1 Tax=Chrysophaeum taylorii TaxID=2483200 RepID=A0AAD7UCD8_9STRA|nr:hypothetical protein CTAYLR_005023 [Chrysophaeum taylorii]